MQNSLVPEARLSFFALDCVYLPNYGFVRVMRQIPLVQQPAQIWPQCGTKMLQKIRLYSVPVSLSHRNRSHDLLYLTGNHASSLQR